MKKLFITAFALSVGLRAFAQTTTYTPVTLTGFTADVVANGSGTVASSTSTDLDGATYALAAQNYVSPTNVSPTGGLPNTGTINSGTTTGVTFQLAPYTGNNSLRIATPGSGTLTFASPRGADQLYVLMTSGSGISTVTITVNFTDNTTQVFSNQSVSDWYAGTNFAIKGLGRVSRATNTVENNANDPRLYQTLLTLTAANAAKIIQSISFNKTSTTGVLNVMGVTARFVTPPAANDVGISAVSGISTGCGLTNQETITVTISNTGTASQTNFPVSYQVNSLPVVTETFTGTVAPFGTSTHTFAAKADLSAVGTYTILTKTLLSGDANATNDNKTINPINSLLPTFPIALDFESASTGMGVFRTTVNTNSAIAEGTAASNGATSTKGLIMDGITSAAWVLPVGVTDPWTSNPTNFSSAKICINPTSATPNAPLWLSFDLKQLFKTANANTNFRVMVNGTQVGPTYRPPFDPTNPATPIVWRQIALDLSAYKNAPSVEIAFESSVKEAYANGSGTANLIDNIQVTRSGPNGVKDNNLENMISVFPNPSQGNFTVNVPASEYALQVTDLTGKVILQQSGNGAQAQVDLSKAAKGIYLLKLTSQGKTAVRKLLVD
jgi:hypothetical protein